VEIFDVFLCHNSEDKQAVRAIAQMLVREGIKPWLDIEQIPPGTSWQTELGEQINSIKSAAVFVGNSGIGPWQNEEIQAFLSQFIERKCPVIPTILGSATTTPELPWTLKNRHRVDFRVSDPDPLKQLIWGITRQKPSVRENLIPGKDELATSKRISVEPRHSTPLAHLPDQDQIGQLEILRRRVKEYWVDGVFKHSLYNEVLISLGRREIGNAVDAPWKYTVQMSDGMDSTPLDDRDVSAIYDTTGLLLILGEPGAGKTTNLLDLARTLLDRAGDDIKERIPIVVNLSSWKKKQPLAEWISNELSEKYRVPRKIGRFWLQRGYLLPLLDGLDEVEISMQPDCVAAINAFVEEFRPSGLVVCCRLNEYRWLPERLKLNGAICIEPLSSGEVGKYLDAGGLKLAALREAVATDRVLQELAQTPLMLSIMSLAYQGTGNRELALQTGDSPEKRRKQIFRLYVEQMCQRKGTASLVFSKERIIVWLSWLAGNMREHSHSVFLVEGLQSSWLGTRAKRVAYGTVVALSLGSVFVLTVVLTDGLTVGSTVELIFGLIFGLSISVGVVLGCWSVSTLRNGVISGSIGGLISGLLGGLTYALRGGRMTVTVERNHVPTNVPTGVLICGLILALIGGAIAGAIGGLGIGPLNHITLVESISWKWSQFWKRTIPGSIAGLVWGLTLALICGLILATSNELIGVKIIFLWLIFALICGLICGLISGLVTGLAGGFIDRVMLDKGFPNQGIMLSLKNSFAAFLVTCLIFGLISEPFVSLDIKPKLIGRLIGALIVAAIVGVVVGLNRGGSAVIKHYSLRLILWLNGYTPLKFIKFLDQCAKLIFLKKVGGGYIFVHRMLLDYFADLNTQSTKAEKGTKGSVGP
jgi:eukaryotic-like serine/threonine-protein kinase